MSNIEKIKEVIDVQYTKDGGYVTLRFKSGLETKRKFNLVVLQYPKKCALMSTDLGIGKQVIYFNIKRQGYGRYYLDPVNVQKARDEHLDVDQEFEYQYHEYTRDTKLRDMLNKIFTANIKHVFSCNVTKNKNSVDFGSASFILVNNKGKFVFVTSSEWASIDLI